MKFTSKPKVVAVLPAYNASKTLKRTLDEIPKGSVDELILVDDCSNDDTVKLAKELGINHVIKHEKNKGYGGNQKTCYRKALEIGADIVIMLHPDYQYTPILIPSMVNLMKHGLYDVVLGSRILGNGALKGGMPIYKYIANRLLTLTQNICSGQKLSEYHTGYRAFTREVLESLNLEQNSDDFIFDNQMLAQIIYKDFQIAEITCPTRYFAEASSINLQRSSIYGLGVLKISFLHLLARIGIYKNWLFK